jgi:NAD(P)-dependent dehydrogenase (short-subunit alcohol dehydrogenase family)
MSKIIVVTGASSGVGLAAAEQFATRGDQVVVVGRDPARLAAAVEKVKAAGGGREPVHFRSDFERLKDVRDLAANLLRQFPTIDVLADNAGGMVGGYRRTEDGFEATIQGNHLGPFLLTSLLRPALDGGRVVVTASDAHRRSRPDPAGFAGDPGSYSPWRAYGASKAANILFAAEAARRWPEITTVSFHPGVVRTNFGSGRLTRLFYKVAPFLVTPEKAGALLVWLATAPASELVDGAYYVGHKVTRPDASAADPGEAAKLWEASAAAVGL